MCFLGVNTPYIPRPDMVEAHFCPFFDRFSSIFFRDVPVINIHMWSDMVETCGQIFMWSNINLTVFLCGCMQRTSYVVNAEPSDSNRSPSHTSKAHSIPAPKVVVVYLSFRWLSRRSALFSVHLLRRNRQRKRRRSKNAKYPLTMEACSWITASGTRKNQAIARKTLETCRKMCYNI